MNTLCRKVGNGLSIRFWKDAWNGGGTLISRFNRLFHLNTNEDCLLSYRRVNDSWIWNWKRQIEGSRNEAALGSLVSDLVQVQLFDGPDSGDGALMMTVNIFAWRLSLDRLLTRLNLSLRGLDIPSIVCPMCNDVVEAVDHVFFGCDLACDVLRLVRRWTNLDMPSFSSWFDCF
nr:hypothetical protein [Tanacetum cinerariifolium]